MKRLLSIIVIIGVILIYLQYKQQSPISTSLSPTPKEDNVTVTVVLMEEKPTPIKSGSKNEQLVFKIVLDTHSVDLNAFDLGNNIFLEDNGRKIKPQQVNTSGSIHHKTAEVVFNSTPPPFTIIVTSLDNVTERKFEFNQLN